MALSAAVIRGSEFGIARTGCVAGTSTQYRGDHAVRRSKLEYKTFAQGAAAVLLVVSQMAIADEEPGDLQEIVVTSQRREESLSKVPVSVSAYSERQMDVVGARDLNDLIAMTPGVQYDPSTNLISIRGISTTAGAATTGVYIDDTPIQVTNIGTASANAAPRIFDLQRVEILRGPQGTLFGAGSEGGTVRFIMNQPSLTEYSGYSRSDLSATQNGGEGYEFGAAYGGPIIDDRLGFRVSAWYQETPGWVNRVDYRNGDVLDSNANSGNTKIVRAALLWKPTDNLKLTPTVQFQESYAGLLSQDVGTYTVAFSNPSQGQYANSAVVGQPTEDKYVLPSLNIEWSLDWATLISDTSYFDRNAPAQEDYTPTLAYLYPAGVTPRSITIPDYTSFQVAEPSSNVNRQYNFIEDVRLQSAPNSTLPLHWVAGAYFAHLNQTNLEEQHESTTPNGINQIPESLFGQTWLQAFGEQPVVSYGVPNGTLSFYGRRQEIDIQKAVYSDVKWNLTDALSIDGGVRVSRDSFSFNSQQDGPYDGGPETFSGGSSETPVTPKYNVSYQLDDNNLLYFTAAKGYRPGGATRPAPVSECAADLKLLGLSTPPSVYKSDSTWSYEVGAKDSFADNRLHLASSAYVVDWTNIQTVIPYPTCEFTYTANVGKARSEGFDLQADAEITSSFLASLAIGHDKAFYTDSLTNPNGAILVRKDDSLGVPPWTATAAGTYNFDLAGLASYFRLQYMYIKRDPNYAVATDPVTVTYNSLTILAQTQSRLNAKFGTQLTKSLELDVYVNNLTDNHPILTQGATFPGIVGGPVVQTTIQPRTMGVTAIAHF
jgi:outer membrane receptor protein involved in Fe transport